jgi:hypothetical protein
MIEEHEQSGVLVIVRLMDVISEFVGCKTEDLIDKNSFGCLRLYHKYKSMRIGFISKKIQQMELIVDKEHTYQKLEKDVSNFINEFPLHSNLNTMINNNFDKNQQLLKELLVPLDKQYEINDLNRKEIIKTYYLIFNKKNKDEQMKLFLEFIMRGDNYHRYKNKNTGLKSVFKIIGDQNYERYKANLYLEKYQEVLNKIQSSK